MLWIQYEQMNEESNPCQQDRHVLKMCLSVQMTRVTILYQGLFLGTCKYEVSARVIFSLWNIVSQTSWDHLCSISLTLKNIFFSTLLSHFGTPIPWIEPYLKTFLIYCPDNVETSQKWQCFDLGDLELWPMTFKNNPKLDYY